MKILGIDPGIGRAGWGIVVVKSPKLEVRGFGCIETSKERTVEERLVTLFESLNKIIEKEKPDTVAIESLFFSTNAKTAMVVGEARGVILLAATLKHLPISTYTPLQVKIAVTGFGQAEKKQVEKMMMIQLDLKERPELDDASDALAIALTHAVSHKIEQVRKKFS